MVITSDGGYRGNKTIALKEIIDEALEKCTSIEKVLVVKEQTLITMKERYLVATLTRWSFRQQCCRNNGFRRSSIHSIYPVRQENRKEWFTPPLVIWFIPLILLKNVFNYEENDIFWCTDIGWITGHSFIFLIERKQQ
jgi:acetyl-CoA synthetase